MNSKGNEQQPAAAQEAVGYVHSEPQFGNAGRKVGVLTCDVPEGANLYAAPVTAALGIDLAALRARVVSAIERITSGTGQMRVPADLTDPDLVLADVLTLLDALDPHCTDSPKDGSEALLREVCELLGDAGCGACAGSMAPMEDLHGRIAAHLEGQQATSPKGGSEARDAALNTLAQMFHNSEEMEGPDGMVVSIDLSLWHEALEAYEVLIDGYDEVTLATSAQAQASDAEVRP